MARPFLRAVVFDLDGTLLNCPYDFAAMRAAVAQVVQRYGLPEALLSGTGLLEGIGLGEAALSGEEGRRFRLEAENEVLRLEREGARHSFPLDGAAKVLNWLHERGLRVGIITRNSGEIVRPILQRAGFRFDALLAREDVARVKPHPDHLLDMLRLLEIRPESALMAGDHIWDMACAKSAGVSNVGLATGTSTKEALLQAGAEAVLGWISELPGWLTASGGLPPDGC